MAPIAFTVSYTLREYLHFVLDHALIVMNEELAGREHPPLSVLPWFVAPFILVPAAIGFFFKRHAMPVCAFHLDDKGIVRTTKDGAYAMAWTDVKAVYRYRDGYLVVSDQGGFPLPRRCWDAAQDLAIAALIAAWEDRNTAKSAP